MKIWLYSSGDGASNEATDLELLRLLPSRRIRFTFIPASFEEAEYYYDEFIDRFGDYSPAFFNILHVDQPLRLSAVNKALASDMIYLSGGNTYHLLAALRRSGFGQKLIHYALMGGVVGGHSAGAIVLTPKITSASYPLDDADDNYFGMRDFNGLNLVGFEVFPHYDGSAFHDRTLLKESERTRNPLYALADGEAISVHGEGLSFFGSVRLFYRGQKVRLARSFAETARRRR